jgi:hypothetical protein
LGSPGSSDSGCGSSAAPAPIPDPGGPFQTSVPPNTPIDALTGPQYIELCNEISSAPYLMSGLLLEMNCRESGFEVANTPPPDGGIPDGGPDGGSFLSRCQAAHDKCIQQPGLGGGTCTLPVYTCAAPVELLSACINEIANTDPTATCAGFPSCAMIAAAGSTKYDGGSVGSCPGAPSLPACTRLGTQCPGALGSFDPY